MLYAVCRTMGVVVFNARPSAAERRSLLQWRVGGGSGVVVVWGVVNRLLHSGY